MHLFLNENVNMNKHAEILDNQLNEIDISPIEDFDAPYYEMKLVKSLINGIYQVSTRL